MTDEIELNIGRRLTMDYAGKREQIELKIKRLCRCPKGEYRCDFSLPILAGDRHIYGEDALHALELCLRHIRGMILSARVDMGMDIWWATPGDNGGFV
jgi:hypothetical protein